MATVPRNIRNNNPGNIKHSADKWRGASKTQTDDVFVQYDSPHFGIRASARNFRTSFKKYGNDTVRKLITRWAPEKDEDGNIINNTEEYISFVAKQMGVGAEEPITVTDPDTLQNLVNGVFRFEGSPAGTYSSEVVRGAVLSGLGLPPAITPIAIADALPQGPDAVAETIKLADDANMTLDQLRPLDQEEVKKTLTVQEILQQVAEAPATSEFLAQPNAMALSHDSVDELSAIEHTINVGRALIGSPIDDVFGGSLRGIGDVAEISSRRLEEFYEGAGLGFMNQASQFGLGPLWMNPTFMKGVEEAGRTLGEALGEVGEAIKPPPEEQNLATDIAGGVGQVAAHITIAVLSGGISGPTSLATLFGQGVDIQSQRLEAEGIEKTTEADLAKIGGGAVTAIVERMGLTLLFKRIPANIRGRMYRGMLGFGVEAVQEVIEGVAHNLIALGLYKPDQDILEGAMRDAMVAGPVGGLVGLLVPGRSPGPTARAHRTLEKSSELIKESRLKARSPEHSIDHAAAAVAEAGITKVYIPIEDIAEYAATHEQGANVAIRQLGIADEFTLNENDEIEIDGALFAANIIGTSNFDALGENIRYVTGGRSASEAAVALTENADAILEQVEETEEEPGRGDITSGLKKRVASLLKQTKEMSPKEVIAAVAEAPADVTNVLDGLLAEVEEKSLDVTEIVRKGRERELSTQLESINKEITSVSQEINNRIAEDRSTKALDKKLDKLTEQRDALIQEQASLEKGGEITKAVRVKGSQIKSIETQTTKRTIAATKRGFKRARSAVKADIKSAQKQFRQIIKDSGVANQAKFLKRLVNLQSTEQLEKILPELEVQLVKELEAQQRKELHTEIGKQLQGTKAPKEQGQFDPETQDLLDIARNALALTTEEAAKELNTSLATDMPGPEQVWRNQMLAVAARDDSVTNDDLRDVLSAIVDLKTEGKKAAAKRLSALQKEINDTKNKMVDATLVGKPIKREDTSTVAKRIALRAKKLGNIGGFNWHAWSDKLDVVFNKKGVDGSFIKKLEMTRELLDVRVRAFRWQKQVIDKALEIYGLKNQTALQKKFYDDSVPYNIGTYVNARGETVDMVISRAEARDLWMKLKDPEMAPVLLHPDGNAYTEDILRDVFTNNDNTKLSSEDMQWAEEQFKFYNSIFGETNEVHRRMFGTNMLFNPRFSPTRTDRGDLSPKETEEVVEHVVIDEQLKRRGLASVTKEDTTAIVPQMLRSDIQVINRYIHDVAHFIETAEKARLFANTFNDPRVKKAIAQNHTDGMNRSIKAHVDDFARGYVKRGQAAEDFIGYFNRNFARSVLAIKATIGIKQTTSVFAMGENIPAAEFTKGLAHFLTNPKKHIRAIFKAMPSLATRGNSLDLELAKLNSVEADILRLKKTNKWDDFLTIMIKWGDRVPIYMGTHARARWDAKQGISFEDSVARSEVLAEQTQQSVQIDQLSDLQRMGPIGRTLTMFMTARLALLRGEMRALRQFRRGKISKAEFGKRIGYYHVVMPALISMIGAGFAFDEPDFIKSITLGQLTSFIFIGDILDAATIDALGGDVWGAVQDIPIVETMDEVRRGMADLVRGGGTVVGFWAAMDDLSNVLGKGTGLPVKQAKNAIVGAYEITEDTLEEVEAGIKRVLGWSERVANKSSARSHANSISFR